MQYDKNKVKCLTDIHFPIYQYCYAFIEIKNFQVYSELHDAIDACHKTSYVYLQIHIFK